MWIVDYHPFWLVGVTMVVHRASTTIHREYARPTRVVDGGALVHRKSPVWSTHVR